MHDASTTPMHLFEVTGDLHIRFFVEAGTESDAIALAKSFLEQESVNDERGLEEIRDTSFWATRLPGLTGGPRIHRPELLTMVHEDGYTSPSSDLAPCDAATAKASDRASADELHIIE